MCVDNIWVSGASGYVTATANVWFVSLTWLQSVLCDFFQAFVSKFRTSFSLLFNMLWKHRHFVFNPSRFCLQSDRAERCTNCTEKNFCDEMGLTFPKTCLSGHYCPPNSIKPTACPPVSIQKTGILKLVGAFALLNTVKHKKLHKKYAHTPKQHWREAARLCSDVPIQILCICEEFLWIYQYVTVLISPLQFARTLSNWFFTIFSQYHYFANYIFWRHHWSLFLGWLF